MATAKESSQLNVISIPEFSSHNGNHLLAVYKGLEATLRDPKKMYQDKVNALLSAWEHVTTFISTSTQEATDGLIEWVHRHTLNVVLQGDWPKLSPATKTHLSVTLQRCAGLLSSHNAAPKCRMLMKLVNDPWGHPILKRIIGGQQEISDDEVLDLCHSEMGVVLTMRLEKLCESKCEDLALRLAEVILRCLNLEGSRLREESTEDQISYILDVYVSLLYKYKRIQDIITYLKCLELKEGLLLIRRYSSKDIMSSRIWKSSGKVAELAAQYFLTVAMVKPVSETGVLLKDLMSEWAVLHSRLPAFPLTLPNMIRKLIQPAESAIHIYTFCEVLVKQTSPWAVYVLDPELEPHLCYQDYFTTDEVVGLGYFCLTICCQSASKFGDDLKPICIELYIRGLTTDMNDLEQQKVKHDNKEKVHEAELRLSDGFLRLADLVKDNVGVCRECILTAFSLSPTRSCFEKIKDMAVASGKFQITPIRPVCRNRQGESEIKPNENDKEKVHEHCENIQFNRCAIHVDTGQVSSMTDTLIQGNNVRVILNQIDTNLTLGGLESSSNKPHSPDTSRTSPVASSKSQSPERSKSPSRSQCPTDQPMPLDESNSCNISKSFSLPKPQVGSKSLCICKSPLRPRTPTSCPTQDTLFHCGVHHMCDPCNVGHLGDLCPQCGEFTGIVAGSSNSHIIGSGIEKKERTLDALISIKGSTVTESLNYDVLSAPNQVLDADALGLTPQLCDDLAVVLSSPRYQMLSWVLDWAELSNLCEKYLDNCEEIRNTTKELKFLNIDYNQFKDWPIEDDDNISGIEKGYEHCAISDISDQEYEFSSTFKKRQANTGSETDSSVVRRARGRTRKVVHRLLSSESDYDSGQTKVNKLQRRRRAASLSISDSDTGTQDSKSDSLGSDGFKADKVPKKDKLRRKEDDSSTQRYTQENLKELSHFRVVMNDDRDDLTSDLSTSDVISIFTQMGENGKEVSNTKFSRTFDSPLRDEINPALSPDKRSSDPSVLKTLRMFRPHNAKKSPRECLSQILTGGRVVHNKESQSIMQEDKLAYTKFAPMLSTLNLNPRIVLTRTDVSGQDLKNQKHHTANNAIVASHGHITPDMLTRKSNCNKNKNKNNVVGNKTQFPTYSLMGDMTSKRKLESIAQAVIDSELLAKSVPGLNSLEMIVPPPIEPTVQVVQFPRNPPTTSSNNANPSEVSTQKVQTSNSSNAVDNCPDAPSSSNHQHALQPSHSLQSNSEENAQSFGVVQTQPVLASAQDQDKQKSNSQMDVKFLTKTSEVNEILRSTLGGSLSQVQTISLVTPPQVSSPGQGKQKLSSQSEVKYLTSTSEVNEILRSTLVENTQQNPTVTSQETDIHGKQKRNVRPEVKCLTTTTTTTTNTTTTTTTTATTTTATTTTSTNELNEILVTTHIQKIGQPPVTSELEIGSSSTVQTDNATQVHSGASVSTLKAVEQIFATLMSSVNNNINNNNNNNGNNNNNTGTVDSQVVSNDSHMLQLLYKKDGQKVHIKPVSYVQNNARSSQIENETNTQISNQAVTVSASVRSNEQYSQSLHSLYEDSFRRYALRTGVVMKCKTPSDGTELTSSQIASLPKFQHAFGKNIYNQTNTSANVDNGSNPQDNPSSSEEPAGPSQASNSSENIERTTQVTSTSSSSSVLSKAVQTSGMNNLASQPNTASTKMPQAESTSTLNVLMTSTLQLNTSGPVVALAQGSIQRHVAGSFKKNRLAVQTVQSPSRVLYDLHQIPSNVESQIIASGNLSSSVSISPQRDKLVKTSQSESIQPSQRTDGTSHSVSVTVATPPVPLITKDSVIRSNMSALLAAALQGSASHRSTPHNTSTTLNTRSSLTPEPEVCIVESSSSDDEGTDATTQTLITSVPMVQRISLPVLQKSPSRNTVQSRVVRPLLQIHGSNLISRTSSTVVASTGTIASPLRQQQVVHVTSASTSTTTSITPNSRLTSQNVGPTDTLMSHGSIEPSVSSTTLEQLREFESVLEQVTNTSQMKERSTVQPQAQPETMHNQQLLLSQATTSSDQSPEFSTNPTSSTSSFSQQFTSVTTTPRVGVAYVSQAPTVRSSSIVPGSAGKITSPVVVVTSYCQPVASPALSVTSQSSSSPCVTPAPTPSSCPGKTPPKASKSSKSKSIKSSPSNTASKASPVPKPQQKPQEDEQTAQRIYAILDEYAEQLRNSPDLNNKPAPRRRSNPPTNPSQSSKRKKSGQTKVKLLGHQSSSSTIEMSPGTDDPRTMGSEDSSSGIMQLSHIQDSPASSAQTADEPQSLRTTPSLDVATETTNVRAAASEAGDISENRQQPRLILTDASGIQGRTVIVQDNVQPTSDVTVSGNATVVAGKPMMVGNATLPLYVPGGVRQVFLPVTPGLTASVQGRPMVMSKGSKVIRVHQVTVPSGSIQVTPGTSSMQGAALVVRQMCVNKPSVGTPMSVLGQPTVKQVKLPMGSISSQALTGVTAQPPVVLPPGSHHLAGPVASVVTHALTFPDSSVEGTVLQDGVIQTESTIISSDDSALNPTSSATIGLIHRGVQSTFHDQINTSIGSSVPADKISYCSSVHASPDTLKLESADILSVSSTSNILHGEISHNSCGEETVSSNNHPVLSIGKPAVALLTNRQSESNSTSSTQQSLTSFQCLSIGFSRQTGVTLRSSISDSRCDLPPSTKSEILTLPTCTEKMSDSHLSISSMCKRTESITECGRLDTNLRSKSIDTLGATSENSKQGTSSKLPDSLCHPQPVVQAEAVGFQKNNSDPVHASSLNEDLFQHDASSVAVTQKVSKEGKFASVDRSQLESTASPSVSLRIVPENGSLNSNEVQTQHKLQDNFSQQPDSSSSSSSSSSSTSSSSSRSNSISSSNDNEINIHVTTGGIQIRGNSTTNERECVHTVVDESTQPKTGIICRTNPTQLTFGTDVGYSSSAKLEYISSDMTYRLPTKMATESRETPWRYVPVVKRVQLIQPMVLRKDDVERSEEIRSSLQLTDNNSEVEDSSQDRRTYISDAKLESVGRKTGISTSAVLNAYRKMEGLNQRTEKRTCDRLEPIQQKMERIEKELKLQKSLSEECEDLGVDEPSTSDLFPEADLLLDTNSSPSFEQTMQDASLSHSVESSEAYSCTTFRQLEYSSSSQEGSHRGSPCLDVKKNESAGSIRNRNRICHTKNQQFDWNYRITSRDKTRHNMASNITRRSQCTLSDNSKLCPLSQDSSVNGSSKDLSANLIEDSSNGGSKDDLSESTSGTLVQEPHLTENKEVLLAKGHLSDCLQNDTSKKLLLEKHSLGKPLHVSTKDLDLELSLDSGSKQVLTEALEILKPFNVSSKLVIPPSPRVNTFSGSSSEDIVTMLDTYASNIILSSLDVTIPSPVPTLPTSVTQVQDSLSSQDPLPSLTAAQKFTHTYGKRPVSGRQEVDRVIKRARLNRPNQYFNDHVDSQETWESSSSQEKTCADDEDSGSQSRTDDCSSTPEQPNSDVDVVDVSNDSFPSTSTTGFSSVSSPKTGVPKPNILENSIKSFNLNGIDLKGGLLLQSKKDFMRSKKVSNNKRTTRNNLSITNTDPNVTEASLSVGKERKNKNSNRSNISHLQTLKSVLHLQTSKSYMPTKQSPTTLSTFTENRKLIVRARKVEECGFNLTVPNFIKPSSTTVTSQDEDVDNLIPLQPQLVEKDNICPVASQCETQLNPLGISRRSSLRGHIKKGCSCCGKDDLDPSKKKKEVLRVEKPAKKGPLKGNVSKKR